MDSLFKIGLLLGLLSVCAEARLPNSVVEDPLDCSAITAGRYVVRDREDPRFYVSANIGPGDTLEMAFSTKVVEKNGTVKRTSLRASEEFENILRHFDGRFKRIYVIYTTPDPDDPYPLRDMIDFVNMKTGQGESLKSAVWESFFGREARRHSFRRVKIDDGGGTPGSYETLQIFFYPSPPNG